MKQILIFDPRNLADLLTHYSQGEFPLGAKILNVATSPILSRHIMLEVEADWDDPMPGGPENDIYMWRYEGRRTLSWSRKDGEEVQWKPADNFADH